MVTFESITLSYPSVVDTLQITEALGGRIAVRSLAGLGAPAGRLANNTLRSSGFASKKYYQWTIGCILNQSEVFTLAAIFEASQAAYFARGDGRITLEDRTDYLLQSEIIGDRTALDAPVVLGNNTVQYSAFPVLLTYSSQVLVGHNCQSEDVLYAVEISAEEQ